MDGIGKEKKMFTKLLRLFSTDSLMKEVKERSDARMIHAESDESIMYDEFLDLNGLKESEVTVDQIF